MVVGVKESVRRMEGMRSDLHLRVQEFKMLELGRNLFSYLPIWILHMG